MSIGYACMVIGEQNTKISACTLKNAHETVLRRLIAHNLCALEAMLDYNIKNNIHLFRISSDIIPFGSHPVNQLNWSYEFAAELDLLAKNIKAGGIRVSMHPGQYTVLNSLNDEVAERAIDDIEYHCRFLDALSVGSDCKIVLHIGGAFNDKEKSAQRFIQNFNRLSDSAKNRQVLENDDVNYTAADVLRISQKLGIPGVFDNLHHALNPSEDTLSEIEWIKLFHSTWQQQDGKQKVHYSQSKAGGRRGAHSDTIAAGDFLHFYEALEDQDIDIMLEVKDKNISALKCSNVINPNITAVQLEKEWARYKYLVLSRSAAIYQQIRELLKNKEMPKALAFYTLIEKAMTLPEDAGAQVNAAQHVWGYVNDRATIAEKNRYHKLLSAYQEGSIIAPLKNHLFQCAAKQNIAYLLQSHYFYI